MDNEIILKRMMTFVPADLQEICRAKFIERDTPIVHSILKESLEDCLMSLAKAGRRRLVIYGAGEHAQMLMHLIDFKDVELVGMVDRQVSKIASKNHINENTTVLHPDALPELKPEIILISAYASGREILNLLKKRDDIGNVEMIFPYDIPGYISKTEDYFTEQLSRIHNADKMLCERKRIVYINRLPYHAISHQSRAIRATGKFQTVLICFDANVEKLVRRDFDIVLNAAYSYPWVARYLQALSPDFVMPVIGAHLNILALIAKASALLSKVIPIVYDFTSLMWAIDDQQIYSSGSQEGVIFERWLEQFALTNCNGLLHKSSDEAINILEKEGKFKSNIPVLAYYPYPDRILSPDTPTKAGRKYRLAFAGTVFPSYLDKAFYGDVQLLPLFQNLLNQGFSVTVYNNPYTTNADSLQIAYSDHLEAARSNPDYKFLEGLPHEKLIPELNKMDFGLMLYQFPDSLRVKRGHIRTCTATKFFLYISADIPILISEELEFMADWVREFKCGIVVKQGEIDNLKGIVEQADWNELKQGVKKAQEAFDMEKNVTCLIDFLKGL